MKPTSDSSEPLNIPDVMARIQAYEFSAPERRPWLLFDPDMIPVIRARAAARDGLLDRVRDRCDKILSTQAVDPISQSVHEVSEEAITMSEGCLLLDNSDYGEWSLARCEYLLNQDNWQARVHGRPDKLTPGCLCDHTMTNVGARMVRVHDFLGDLCSEAYTERLGERLRYHLLEPFLTSVRERKSWWATREMHTNWKIMCHGETGLVACAFVDDWPEAREVMALAARGVLETLDDVPAEGDWYEGVHYWLATLFMGLRYAQALRRLSGGEIDLFTHPILSATGNFASALTTPGGRIYNYADNADTLDPRVSCGQLMLALEKGNSDWLAVARTFPGDTVFWLANDDPEIPSDRKPVDHAEFPSSGVAMMRSRGGDRATFVGFRSGPSKVSHGHLDANSFVLESGGAMLLMDSGKWPYAHLLGSDEYEGPRWCWDNHATIGHNSLLVDGAGQTSGEAYPGRIVKTRNGDNWHMIIGDAALCYPGMLTKFIRTILLLGTDTLIIRDVVECVDERHVEWLMHYCGDVTSQGEVSQVENDGVRLYVTPFLPDRSLGWRVSDVTRTSVYENSDTVKTVEPSVRFRSFSPFRKASSFEFLFGMRIDHEGAGTDWEFIQDGETWTLRAGGSDVSVSPDGDTLSSG